MPAKDITPAPAGTVAPAAYATFSGSNCVGTLIEAHDLTAPSGKVLGYLNPYWDGSTGQNCETVTSSSIDWGIPKRMYADPSSPLSGLI